MKPVRLVFALAALLVACGAPTGTSPLSSPSPVISPTGPPPSVAPASVAGPPPSVTGIVTAGPVCPVMRNPPDVCVPGPVAGAVIVATNASGQEVGRTTTGTDGSYRLIVSATGTVVISALPVVGLMRVPAPVTVTLAFPSATQRVDLEYDTGIR